MAVSILMAVLFGLLLVNYRLDRSVLYPPFILCFMWLLVFSIYQTHVIEIDPLHVPTLLLVGGGMALFTLGGLVAMLLPRALFTTRVQMGPLAAVPRQGSWIPSLMIGLGLLGMVLVIRSTFILGAGGSGATILARARDVGVAAQEAGEAVPGANPIALYTPVYSTLFSVIFLLERRRLAFWAMAAISLTAGIFSTGRVPIVMLFLSLMTAYLLREHRLRFLSAIRVLRIPFFIMMFLYIVLIFTTKNLSNLSGGILAVVIFMLGSYFISPVVALDYVLRHPVQYAHEPNHTFKFVLGALTKLHLATYTPPPLLDTFVTVPFPTNVYTGFKFYYTDFGVFGCLLVVTFIGFVHALIYRKARFGSELFTYIFAATVFPAVMFIFDDLYSALGEDLNILLVGLLYFGTRSLLARSPLPVLRLPGPRSRFRLFPRLRLLPRPDPSR